ncbi:MAG: hypothetical protein E6J34_17850 [Chloroflexi bacterium]|nr:MAG: hypothetical protein E6J34_17850 [Chloroflexota bacterium]
MITQAAATQSLDRLRIALIVKFPSEKVDEILKHYNILRREARLEHWETCLVNGGKFVEAVLKCFHYLCTGTELDAIKANDEIKRLENATHLSDFERLTVSRALRLMYEFRNKRGGAHNSSFDPIKTDCALVVAISNWVMEELTRLYLTNDATAAKARLVLRPGLSARIQLEILLYREFPARCAIKDLIRWVHDHSMENIRVTLRSMRQKNLVHETDAGWKLTESGMQEAEAEINKLHSTPDNAKLVIRRKAKGAKHARK